MAYEPLLKDRRFLIFKNEGTAGTAETLTSADATIKVRGDIKLSKSVEEYASKFATGDHDFDPSVMGRATGTVSFAVDLYVPNGSALGTVPAYAAMLRSCGIDYGTNRTTTPIGVSFVRNVLYDGTCSTIWIVTPVRGLGVQVVTKLKGCMGNVKIIVDRLGTPFRAEFEFKGVLYAVVDVAAISALALHSSVDNEGKVAERVISTTITLGAKTQKLDKLTFDAGNKVEPEEDAGASGGQGITQFSIVGSDPMIEIDPLAVAVADEAVQSLWQAGTTGAFTSKSTNITLKAAKAQIIDANEGDRGGKVVDNKKLRLCRDTTAGSPFTLLIGADA